MSSIILDRSIISFRLKVFWSVAKNLSFTQAAQELFISQPAISKHIQELELEKGLRFFNRGKNQISLTQAGKRLYAYTEEILSAYRRLEAELEAFRSPAQQQLRLGAGTTMAQYMIPGILSQFRQHNAQHHFSLFNGTSDQVIHKVLQAELDLGIVETKDTRHKKLCYEPYLKEEVVAVANAHHLQNFYEPMELKELLNFPLLIRSQGSGTRDILLQALKMQHIPLEALSIRMEFESAESLKNFLLSDDGVGFLPEHAVQKEVESGQLKRIHIKSLRLIRHYSFVYRKDLGKGLSQAFMAFAREHIT